MAYPGTERSAVFAAAPGPDIAANLAAVQGAIARAARAAGRTAAEVELLAVSKTQPAEVVAMAIAVGQRAFGENRVQEAQAKWPELRDRHADLRLHLIGPLQTNKAREAVALFDVIQSLDRERLAQSLAAEMARAGRRPRLYIQVNIGAEPQKSGVAIEELPRLLTRCRELGLAIEGLMCIPPAEAPPEPYFGRLAALARDHGLAGLSMGMSGDYAVAIAAGATLVRVGSAIFGRRPAPPG